MKKEELRGCRCKRRRIEIRLHKKYLSLALAAVQFAYELDQFDQGTDRDEDEQGKETDPHSLCNDGYVEFEGENGVDEIDRDPAEAV